MARSRKRPEALPTPPVPEAVVDVVDVGAAIEKERNRLQRRLDAALKEQKKRQRQLAAAEKTKRKKGVAKRRRQAGVATNRVTTLAEKLALLGGSTASPPSGAVAAAEAEGAVTGAAAGPSVTDRPDGQDGPA